MLLNRLIRRKQSSSKPTVGWAAFLVLLIICAAVALKVYGWFAPPERVPILPDAPGLEVFFSEEALAEESIVPAFDLARAFDANVHTAGQYTLASEVIQKGTVIVVLEKNEWRFVEIFDRKEVSLEDALKRFSGNRSEDVDVLGVPAKMIQLDLQNLKCISANETHPTGVCQITRVLLFETNSRVISIAADGNHATEGELLLMGKIILESQTKNTSN